jgi:periplasmic protein TonB
VTSYGHLQGFGSDGTALILTTLLAASVLVALRTVTPELPRFVHDREVALTVEAAPPAPPAPPTPLPQQPVQKRHTPTLRQEQSSDPQPIAMDPALADTTPIATLTAASPPAPSGAAHPDLDARYAAELRADIDRRTAPPDTPQYRLHHPAGETRVRFVVLRSGSPEAAVVERSSGSSLLDEEAVRIVSSGHYPPMPANAFAGESRHVFVVTIEFRPASRV